MKKRKKKFCPKCGAELKQDDQYCMSCGYSFKKRKKKPSWLIILIVIIIFLVLWVIIRRYNSQPIIPKPILDLIKR